MFPVEIWGTVGQWFGSVLTGGSLILGFSILRRDRETARRAQAAMVTFESKLTANHLEVTAYNHSNASLTFACVGLRFTKDAAKIYAPDIKHNESAYHSIIFFSDATEAHMILPGTTATINHALTPPIRSVKDVTVRMMFCDAKGDYWERETRGELVGTPANNRIAYWRKFVGKMKAVAMTGLTSKR